MAKMKVMSSAVALTMVMMMMLASSIDDAEAKVIVVGGEQRWHYGFNYSQWASSLAPVYVGDILEFKFDKPGVNTTAHNVYVFKNKLAYKTCDIKQATELSSPDKGAGPKGYRFVLRKAHAYFFACGIGQGFHCQDGLMKFGVSVLPLPKPAHHTSSITISN